MKLDTKNLIIITLILSITAVVIALISQYFFNLLPCKLCLYQRYFYYLIIVIGILALIINKHHQKFLITMLICYVLNALTAFYHSLVEKKILAGPNNCGSSSKQFDNLEQLAQTIKQTPAISCANPTFLLFNLSFTNYNLIYCAIIVILMLFLIKKTK